jgi:hypothetical protein
MLVRGACAHAGALIAPTGQGTSSCSKHGHVQGIVDVEKARRRCDRTSAAMVAVCSVGDPGNSSVQHKLCVKDGGLDSESNHSSDSSLLLGGV